MADRTTYCEAALRVSDAEAKSGAELSLSGMLPQSDIEQIRDDDYIIDGNIGTFERGGFPLDGDTLLVPSDTSGIRWGAWTGVSGSDGAFAENPELSAVLDAAYTTSGITLTFAGNALLVQTITTWYSGETVLAVQTDDVTGATHFIARTVEGSDQAVIELVGTTIPENRIRIAEIDFGQIYSWSRDKIISANALEEVDLTSTELTIDTLGLSVHDENDDFNMLNPAGIYERLQEKQLLMLFEYINGVKTPMGRWYLDTWSNTTPKVADFEFYGAIGLFDSVTFRTSAMYNGTAAGTIYAAIFASAGWTKYTIDADIAAEPVYGYIPIVSVREALQQLSFALRAACLVSRNGVVQIRRLPSAAAANAIEKSQKMGDQKIKQNALTNSVAVTAYAFTVAAASTQLYSAALAAGTYEISFGSPAAGLSCTGGTITASGINFATVEVTAAGTVTVSGYKYETQTAVYLCELAGLTDLKRSQVTVDGVYLISAANGTAVAQNLYDDYQRRIVQTFELALEDEQIGDNVDVDTMLGARKTGVITKLDIDLTGGLIAGAEVRG